MFWTVDDKTSRFLYGSRCEVSGLWFWRPAATCMCTAEQEEEGRRRQRKGGNKRRRQEIDKDDSKGM